MNSHCRLIAIIGIALSIVVLSLSYLDIYDIKYLFYMQTLIVIAVCFHVIIGKPIWNEKVASTKLKSLFVAIIIFMTGLISFIIFGVFRAYVLSNVPLFVFLLILIAILIIMIIYKGKMQ